MDVLEVSEIGSVTAESLIPHHSSLITHSSLLITHHSSLITHYSILADITPSQVYLFGFGILVVFLLTFLIFYLGSRARRKSVCLSPYTGVPLRRTIGLPFESQKKVAYFLQDLKQYDNRPFKFKYAALCRDTGRIFTDCVTWLDTIDVDWTFLKKRFPGRYVSWGSLTEKQKLLIRKLHHSLEDFQTEESSPQPAPSAIEPKYVFTKPGPLYVDVDTNVLLGWQCVPDTEFEVLIVQKPKPLF